MADFPRISGDGHEPSTPSGVPGDVASLIDYYLDGMLDAAQRAAFEAELARNIKLREAIELQRRIDTSLRSSFAPEVVEVAAGRTDEGASIVGSVPAKGRFAWLRVAALIALVGLAVFTYYMRSQFMGDGRVAPVAAYQKIADEKFSPQIVCTTEAEFRRFAKNRYGREFAVRPVAGLMLTGWSYDPIVLGEQSSSLLAKYEGSDIVVFMDTDGQDLDLSTRTREGLHVFKKKAAGMVFYEVTPREKAVVIENIVE